MPCPPPVFAEKPGPGGEGDSFGLQGARSSLAQAGFSRFLSAGLRSRLPLRKHTQCSRENFFPPGFLIHRPPRRAILARKKLRMGKGLVPDNDNKVITPNPDTNEINDASAQGVPRNAGGRGHLQQKRACQAFQTRNDCMDKFVVGIRYRILERGFFSLEGR